MFNRNNFKIYRIKFLNGGGKSTVENIHKFRHKQGSI